MHEIKMSSVPYSALGCPLYAKCISKNKDDSWCTICPPDWPVGNNCFEAEDINKLHEALKKDLYEHIKDIVANDIVNGDYTFFDIGILALELLDKDEFKKHMDELQNYLEGVSTKDEN